jgi:aspartate carbamoyltransferase catalytic subunit
MTDLSPAPAPALPLRRRRGDPRPLTALAAAAPVHLLDRSLISVLDVSRTDLLALFSVAARLQAGIGRATRVLNEKILLTAFFEPSTRTRLSFESGMHRLGGSVISIPDARFTSVHKGESLSDTGVMMGTYADVVVLRHTSEESVDEIRAGGMTAPVINGGNGCDEHPTQAMADWYALMKWRPALALASPPVAERISLCILGTPMRMRSIRSFLRAALAHFPGALKELTIVSDDDEAIDATMKEELAMSGIPFRVSRDFHADSHSFDVIYQNSLTLVGQKYQVLGPKIRLDRDTRLKPDAVVMHPLARQDELSTDLDDTPHNLYFDQAEGALFVRQALLLAITGRTALAFPGTGV